MIILYFTECSLISLIIMLLFEDQKSANFMSLKNYHDTLNTVIQTEDVFCKPVGSYTVTCLPYLYRALWSMSCYRCGTMHVVR